MHLSGIALYVAAEMPRRPYQGRGTPQSTVLPQLPDPPANRHADQPADSIADHIVELTQSDAQHILGQLDKNRDRERNNYFAAGELP